jgi:hypothetical protein
MSSAAPRAGAVCGDLVMLSSCRQGSRFSAGSCANARPFEAIAHDKVSAAIRLMLSIHSPLE